VNLYQKGKTDLDFTEARDSEWQWHQLGHMQVCTSLQTDNHASTPPLSFFTGGMPFLQPNQQRQNTEGVQSTEGIQSTISLASAEKSLKFSVFGPWWGLLYHPKLRRHSGRFCFVYICESLILFDTLVSDESLASLHVFTY